MITWTLNVLVFSLSYFQRLGEMKGWLLEWDTARYGVLLGYCLLLFYFGSSVYGEVLALSGNHHKSSRMDEE